MKRYIRKEDAKRVLLHLKKARAILLKIEEESGESFLYMNSEIAAECLDCLSTIEHYVVDSVE